MLKRLKNIINNKPKTTILATIFALAAIISIPLVTSAYGPNRPTYDWNKYNSSASCTDPSNAYGRCGSMNGPVFDSFINTPSYGDEENFNTIAPVVAGQAPNNASYSETTTAISGNEYWVRTLVHNNANQNLNCLPEHRNPSTNNCNQIDPGSPSIATGAKIRMAIASGQANGVDIETYISADNSAPKLIWDTSTLVNKNQAFEVSYVPGSAVIYNGAHQQGLALSDNIASANGTALGYNQMDGVIPGCFDYSSYVYFKVHVKTPGLKITKQVRTLNPTSAWSSSVKANKGDVVEWRITYQNTSNAVDNQVTLRDVLPKDLSLVPNTIKWYDAFNKGTLQPDNALNSGGVNLGNYAPSANDINGQIVFDTKISNNPTVCTINNTAFGRAQNVSETSAQASVIVNNCVGPNPPTPGNLPNTGPGDVIGVFVASVAAGYGAFRMYLRKKLGLNK